jgi:hypothetical protein
MRLSNFKLAMKTLALLAASLFLTVAGHAQQTPPSSPPAAPANELANYVIRVEWNDSKSDPKFLEVMTTPGEFELNTFEKNSVKINGSDVPVTLRLTGTLTVFDDQKGKLRLFLGRTVPYVTSTYGTGSGMSSSYSQMSVGLQSNFAVTFGKPLVVQTDDSGEITILVKRVSD